MGVDRPLLLVLDLSEAVNEVCSRLHDLGLHWLRSGKSALGFDYGKLLNFDPVPMMEMLIDDFRNLPTAFNTTDFIAEHLQAQGVPANLATQLSSDLHHMTFDIIGGQLPNFTFTDLATNCILQLTGNGRVLGVTFLSGMEFDRKNVPKY